MVLLVQVIKSCLFILYLILQQLLHRNVDVIERRPSGGNSGTIVIKCKDLRIVQLEIIGSEEFHNVSNSLEWLSNLGTS